jgi:hypothetical protein
MIILGNIGIVCLEKKIDNKLKKILIFSDAHSGHRYCTNSTITIADFIKSKLNNKNQILLEEVERNNLELKELWPDSEHTQDLKKLYLENADKIIPIDIRPYLRDFSWELLEIDKNLGKISFFKYMIKFKNFFTNKKNFIYIKVKKLVKDNLIMKSTVKKHLKYLYFKLKKFLKENKNFLNKDINYIYKNNIKLLKFINDFADEIMEWYTIINALSYSNIDKISIIHTGLFHSDKIINLLKTEYDFKEIYSNGLNKITKNNNINNNVIACTFFPNNIRNKFGIY